MTFFQSSSNSYALNLLDWPIIGGYLHFLLTLFVIISILIFQSLWGPLSCSITLSTQSRRPRASLKNPTLEFKVSLTFSPIDWIAKVFVKPPAAEILQWTCFPSKVIGFLGPAMLVIKKRSFFILASRAAYLILIGTIRDSRSWYFSDVSERPGSLTYYIVLSVAFIDSSRVPKISKSASTIAT